MNTLRNSGYKLYFTSDKTYHHSLNSNFRDASRDSTSEDEGVFSLKPHQGPSSTISAPEVLMHEQDLTPKHYIRTPILEETESNMEAELLSRQMSREHDR